MANLARYLLDRPLSRKGMARPMPIQGTDGSASLPGAVAWHPSAMQRLHMAAPCGATPHATALARSVERMRPQRVRISTRLDPDLHDRLMACAAARRRTQQSLVVQALEEFLDRHGEPTQRFGDRRTPAPR